MNAQFHRCWCGRLYKSYSMFVGDQSQCPRCRAAEEEEYRKQEEQDAAYDAFRQKVKP